MPKILVIQLKRFSYRSRHWREKIESHVNFPLEGLDMTPHVKGPIKPGEEPIYDLFAVDNHYGALGGGHYTAYARNINLRKWFKFDDSSVTEVSDPQQVVTPAAYILFYRRRDATVPDDFQMPPAAKYANEPEEQEQEDEEEEGATGGTDMDTASDLNDSSASVYVGSSMENVPIGDE